MNEFFLKSRKTFKLNKTNKTTCIIRKKFKRKETRRDSRHFNSQSLLTQGQKSEEMIAMLPDMKKLHNILGKEVDEVMELNAESRILIKNW